MLFTPVPLSHLLGPPSSVTYFMDGPMYIAIVVIFLVFAFHHNVDTIPVSVKMSLIHVASNWAHHYDILGLYYLIISSVLFVVAIVWLIVSVASTWFENWVIVGPGLKTREWSWVLKVRQTEARSTWLSRVSSPEFIFNIHVGPTQIFLFLNSHHLGKHSHLIFL